MIFHFENYEKIISVNIQFLQGINKYNNTLNYSYNLRQF